MSACCLMSRCALRGIRCLTSTCALVNGRLGAGPGFAGGDGEQLGGQGLDLALGGGGIDQGVSSGQRHDALYGHCRVIDRAMKRGGRLVVFLGYLGAFADRSARWVTPEVDDSRGRSSSSRESGQHLVAPMQGAGTRRAFDVFDVGV
jgi:hypothetical protein